jgi:hypothetical protein
MRTDDREELTDRRICENCIDEAFLKEEVSRLGKRRKCSYCHLVARTYSIEKMAERVETALEQFYARTQDEPDEWGYLRQREFGDTWIRDGEEIINVIEEAAIIPRDAAEDIQEILDEKYSDVGSDQLAIETEYSSESCYDLKDHDDKFWKGQWDLFAQSVKHHGRMFNDTAKKVLESIFDGFGQLRTYRGQPVIIDTGPSKSIALLYRARVFVSDSILKEALANPDRQLGPPPPKLATAGRMNSRGISVFYGASSPEVAISEVRPPVGSKVAVASFQIIRPLKILDLGALTSIMATGSIFDPEELARRERLTFLRTLADLITLPIMPGEEELEYIPTQAIADFLAENASPIIDGIQFSSVQSGGKGMNIVLFHRSSAVEPLQRPAGTKVEVGLGFHAEDSYGEYSVYEKRSSAPEIIAIEKSEGLLFPGTTLQRGMTDSIDNYALKIDIHSIKVHEVRACSFVTDTNLVTWITSDGVEGLDDVPGFDLE